VQRDAAKARKLLLRRTRRAGSALARLDASEPLSSVGLLPGKRAASFRIADHVDLQRDAVGSQALIELEDAASAGRSRQVNVGVRMSRVSAGRGE
jgi:hypothetical protein